MEEAGACCECNKSILEEVEVRSTRDVRKRAVSRDSCRQLMTRNWSSDRVVLIKAREYHTGGVAMMYSLERSVAL